MASAIGKIATVFSASTSGLTSGVNQAKSAFASLESSTRSTAASMRALVAIQGAQLFGSIASAATGYVRSLIQIGQAQAEVIDRTSKLAERLGMTYGEFSGLALAGDLAGVSMDTLAAAATKADVAFVKAANGSKPAIAAFNSLGLSVSDLSGINPAERFDAIANAIAALPTEAQRAAAAVALFGRSGAELLPLFNGGADAIREAREEAERFGLALTTAQGKDVEAMNDAFTRAQKAVEGIVSQIVAYLSPAVTRVFTVFSDFVKSVGGANIGQSIAGGILNAAKGLAAVADWAVENFADVFRFFGSVFQNVGEILLSAAASLASVIPGFEKQTAQMQANLINLQAGLPMFAASASGPLAAALQDLIDQAETSANQIEDAKPATPPQIQQVVQVAGITEALKGIDSRSKEGVSEMFRIMRGDPGNIQEQQLSVLEEIAANTAAQDDTATAEF